MNYISEDFGEFELELSQSSNTYAAFNKLLKMLDGINNKILKELFKYATRYKEKEILIGLKCFCLMRMKIGYIFGVCICI